MTSDPTSLTLAEAAELVGARKLSPVELTRACLERIARYDGAIHSFVTVTADAAVERARAAEAEIAAGRYRGPLHGIPFALKDIIETAGVRTTAHSNVLIDHVPNESAVVVSKLEAAGAICLGKLGCLEFAHASPSSDQPFPQVLNPWDTARAFTGGSSTGSAAAVAAGFAPVTLGTDTGGSVRNPAAHCGIAGLMPTYGRVSRRGVIPYSFSLDHVGPLARTVRDCALALNVIAGYDPDDPGSADVPVPDFTAGLGKPIKGLKIGFLRHFTEKDMIADDEVRAGLEATRHVLAELGAEVGEARARPLLDYHDVKLVIGAAEFWAVHEQDFMPRFSRYGADLKTKTFQGAFLSAADYIQAQRQRRKLAVDMARTIEPFDVLLSATVLKCAPRADETAKRGGSFVHRPNITSVFNVTAYPSISISSGFSRDGLPLSALLVARPFDEVRLLQVAHAIEQAMPWHKQRPCLSEPES